MVKNMKKVICGILCMMMVFSMFTVSAATLTIDEENIVVSDADATTGLRTVTIGSSVQEISAHQLSVLNRLQMTLPLHQSAS